MKVSLGWVGDFVDLDGVAPEEVAELLSLHTAEVEGMERYGEALADVRIGLVVECSRHPDADRLSLTRVEFGGGETVPVVCGAPNVRQGLKVAFAPVGATLPGGLKIKKAKLRGQLSCGMICSSRELDLGDDHRGILELPEDAPVGASLVEWLGLADVVLELDNKSLTHRPDLWGHYGFARELAAILGRELRPLPVLEDWPGPPAAVPVTLEDPDGCPMYLALQVELAAPPRPSAGRIRQRLLAVGQRPLNDVVDLTNYVLHELGQPTHAFDLARLSEPAILVRSARGGETLTTLDGVERRLDPRDLLIWDGARAVALAGVMGGEATEVQEDTTAILLESAVFQPARIRRTSARHGLRTDASARFEKSLDPALAELALRRFALLLQELRPEARLAGAPARAGHAEAPRLELSLDPTRTARLLGVELAAAEMAGILDRLGFAVSPGEGGRFQVQVPSWRATRDVTTEVDLVEEVGRLAGYHRIRPAPMVAPVVPAPDDPLRLLARRLADRLALAHGGYESEGYSFLDRRWAERLHLPLEAFVRLHNPVQDRVDLVRRDPVPSLLEQAARNLREREAALLFEVGRGYEPRAGDLPRERHWLAAVAWQPAGGPAGGPESLAGRCRSLFEDLCRACAVPLRELRSRTLEGDRLAAPWGHPARLLEWYAGEEFLGCSGPVDPRLLPELDLERVEVGAVLLDLAALARVAEGQVPAFRPPGRFPAIKVDVALDLPEEVPYAAVREALEQAGGRLLESLELFDLYTGGCLGAGRRSLAFHALLRAPDRTLEEKDERRFLERAARAAAELGGRLRGGAQEPSSGGA